MALIPDSGVDAQTQLTAGGWRLYCYLARCRNRKSGKCCPSFSTTMKDLKIKRASLYSARKELQDEGWAVFDRDNVGGLFGFPDSLTCIDSYFWPAKNADSPENWTSPTIPSPEIQTSESINSDNKSEFLDNKSRNSDCHIGSNQRIQPGNKTSKKKDGAVAPTLHLLPSFSAQVIEVFEYWKNFLNHPNAKLTSDRRTKIEQRLKQDGYTVEQLKLAIQGCSKSLYHQGGNEQGRIYDDIELICRKGTKVEQFIALNNPPKRNGQGYVGKESEPTTAPKPSVAKAGPEPKERIGVWGKVLDKLEEILPSPGSAIPTWFEPLRPQIENDGLILTAPDEHYRTFILNNFEQELQTARDAVGLTSCVIFVAGERTDSVEVAA